MKFLTLASTLSTLTLVSAFPKDGVYRRQVVTNSTLPLSGSGANSAVPRSANSSSVSTTPTGNGNNAPVPATTTTQQFYTYTTVISSTATQVFQIPINGNGAVSPGQGVVPVAPGSGGVAPAPGGNAGNAPAGNGVTTVFVTRATLTTTVGNGQCVCATPAVTATGVIPVTVQTQVVVGGSTYTTSGVQTTIAPFVFQNGQAAAVTPVVTTTVTALPNGGAGAVAGAGQQLQTITIPASGSTPAYIVVVLVTVTNNYIPVVAPVPTGNGGNAGAPFGNSSATIQPIFPSSASSLSALVTSSSGILTTIPISSATGSVANGNTAIPQTTATTAVTPTTTNTAQATGACPTLSSVGANPRSTDQEFIQALLCQHNQYRTRNQAAPLVWDPNLAAVALAAVQYNLANNQGVDLTHTYQFNPAGNPYGENLGALGGAYNNYQHNVWDWYNEINSYSFANPGFSASTGHFTQLVWASSTALGCAAGYSADGQRHIIACEYNPPGNYAGEYQANVLPTNNNIAFPAEPAYIIPN